MNNYSVFYSLDSEEQKPFTWFSETPIDDVSNEVKEWLQNRNPDKTVTIISITKVIY